MNAYLWHYSPLYNTPYAPGLSDIIWPLFLLAVVWTIILKGFALWYAARGHQKWWFVALLIVNTLGILEIVYLIWFRPRSSDMHGPAQSSSAPSA